MGWLRLNEATSLMDHRRAESAGGTRAWISKAWPMGSGGWPVPTSRPNVPLRIQVVPLSGLPFEGRAWLRQPRAVLGRVRNRMSRQSLGTTWEPLTRFAAAPTPQVPATIEVSEADILRLSGRAER